MRRERPNASDLLNNSKSICGLLKTARISQGLSQSELARLSGVSRFTIINLESKKADLTLKIVEKIMEALGLELTFKTQAQHWEYIENIIFDRVRLENEKLIKEKIDRNRLMKALRVCFFSIFYDEHLSHKSEKLKFLKILKYAICVAHPRLKKKFFRIPVVNHIPVQDFDMWVKAAREIVKDHLKKELKDDQGLKRGGPVPYSIFTSL